MKRLSILYNYNYVTCYKKGKSTETVKKKKKKSSDYQGLVVG